MLLKYHFLLREIFFIFESWDDFYVIAFDWAEIAFHCVRVVPKESVLALWESH